MNAFAVIGSSRSSVMCCQSHGNCANGLSAPMAYRYFSERYNAWGGGGSRKSNWIRMLVPRNSMKSTNYKSLGPYQFLHWTLFHLMVKWPLHVQTETFSRLITARKSRRLLRTGTWQTLAIVKAVDFRKPLVYYVQKTKSGKLCLINVGRTHHIPISVRTIIEYASLLVGRVYRSNHHLFQFRTWLFGPLKTALRQLWFRPGLWWRQWCDVVAVAHVFEAQ